MRILLALLCLSAAPASSATLGLDPASKALIGDFTATFTGTSELRSASGTTNGGVAWSVDTRSFDGFSDGTGTNIGDQNGSNTAPQFANDWIHIDSGFTLTFDQVITSILFSVSEDDARGNIISDTGTAPLIEGPGLSLSGTTVQIGNPVGGFVLYTGLNSATFTSIAAPTVDGSNYAFAVSTAPVAPEIGVIPLPASLPLALAGLGALAALRRRRN